MIISYAAFFAAHSPKLDCTFSDIPGDNRIFCIVTYNTPEGRNGFKEERMMADGSNSLLLVYLIGVVGALAVAILYYADRVGNRPSKSRR